MLRGEVYYIDLSPVFGSEQGGCRPCVVLQNDTGNKHSGTTIIAPMTVKLKHRLRTHVQVTTADKGLDLNSVILLEQIRVVDRGRFENFVCRLSKETMERVDKAIEISLALNKEERSEEEMNEIIVINNHELKIKEFNGQRVVTFKDIDTVHERVDGTANKRFLDNKKHFIEGEDFFVVSNSEIRKSRLIPVSNNDYMDKTLITESGYLMLVKSLTDDLAWEVQRKLVKSYFNKKKQLTVQEMMREQLGMIDGIGGKVENLNGRVEKIENTMNIDYGQQRVLEKEVAAVVIESLGGKESNAYAEMSKKVFSECNRDVKDYFHVNSRNNIPRIRFDDAVEYIRQWMPCTNTKVAIRDCNAQMSI